MPQVVTRNRDGEIRIAIAVEVPGRQTAPEGGVVRPQELKSRRRSGQVLVRRRGARSAPAVEHVHATRRVVLVHGLGLVTWHRHRQVLDPVPVEVRRQRRTSRRCCRRRITERQAACGHQHYRGKTGQTLGHLLHSRPAVGRLTVRTGSARGNPLRPDHPDGSATARTGAPDCPTGAGESVAATARTSVARLRRASQRSWCAASSCFTRSRREPASFTAVQGLGRRGCGGRAYAGERTSPPGAGDGGTADTLPRTSRLPLPRELWPRCGHRPAPVARRPANHGRAGRRRCSARVTQVHLLPRMAVPPFESPDC